MIYLVLMFLIPVIIVALGWWRFMRTVKELEECRKIAPHLPDLDVYDWKRWRKTE